MERLPNKGVEGSTIKLLGTVSVTITLAGLSVGGDFLVAEALNTEAILGLDFLEQYRCTINTRHRILHLQGKAITLQEKGNSASQNQELTPSADVVLPTNLPLPPWSEIEILADACIPEGLQSTTTVYLVESKAQDTTPSNVTIAHALVRPKLYEPRNHLHSLPLRMINLSLEKVQLYKGMKLAIIEPTCDPELIAKVDQPEQNSSQGKQPYEPPPEIREEIWAMVESSGEALDKIQQNKLYNLLVGYSGVFARTSADLGRTDRLCHKISKGTEKPIRQPARRIPPYRREEVNKLLQDMLSSNVIQSSASPWASPVVLVQKKDGSVRFCIDYCKLNALIRKDAYPLPRIDNTLDTLSGSKWFSTLDLLSGYWQVEVAEQDREKTPFTTQQSLFEFRVMPFGLCNAPVTFQRLMDLVLAGIQWSKCLVYLDDIIIVGRNFDEHLHNLATVLHKLKAANLRTKPSKCALCQKQVTYLGHVVSKDGISADTEKTLKVANWPTPTSVQVVQQFLRLASYYRRFIKNFATIAKHYTSSVKKGSSLAGH